MDKKSFNKQLPSGLTLISPSLLSFNFASIGAEAVSLINSGADMLHLDVMDGVFVPNITFGMKFVADLAKHTSAFLDVHLMITKPERYVCSFADAGADLITIHYESTSCVAETLAQIRSCGVRTGLSIKPNTPVEVLEPYLDLCDLILVMSVEPGFGGQSFKQGSLQRIAAVKRLIGERDIMLQVDGGVTLANAKSIINAGCNCLVAGSAIYSAPMSFAAAIAALRNG